MFGCPYCGAPSYECYKNGRNPNGTQRYHCRLCQRHFTPAARAKKRQNREQAHTLMALPGMSARQAAARLGVHHRTILRWQRH